MTTETLVQPTAPRILPPITPASRPYWTGGAQRKLMLFRDGKSGRWLHPFDALPADVSSAEAQAVSGKGKIFTFTVNYQTYNPDAPPPYVIAIVVLDEQDDLRIPTNIVNCDPDTLEIGMPVSVVFEQNGEIFIPLFEPAR